MEQLNIFGFHELLTVEYIWKMKPSVVKLITLFRLFRPNHLNCRRANEKRSFGRKLREEVAVVCGGFLIHLPHSHKPRQDTQTPKYTHTQIRIKPLVSFLSFVFSLLMSYSSVAIGYLTIRS